MLCECVHNSWSAHNVDAHSLALSCISIWILILIVLCPAVCKHFAKWFSSAHSAIRCSSIRRTYISIEMTLLLSLSFSVRYVFLRLKWSELNRFVWCQREIYPLCCVWLTTIQYQLSIGILLFTLIQLRIQLEIIYLLFVSVGNTRSKKSQKVFNLPEFVYCRNSDENIYLQNNWV